jgi:cytochrome oxidase assembly protein ShyY1
MIRRLPVMPTIVVAAAVALMVALGFWQLGKAPEKQARIDRYQAAQKLPPIAFPTTPQTGDLPLYRYATAMCLQPAARRAIAGRNRADETGYVHIVRCSSAGQGAGISVQIGWSRDPSARFNWNGGVVSGIIVPDGNTGLRLVAATPAPGLAASAAPLPTVAVTPARHRGYAATWFSFAAIAMLIYALAVRQRLKETPPAP